MSSRIFQLCRVEGLILVVACTPMWATEYLHYMFYVHHHHFCFLCGQCAVDQDFERGDIRCRH
jgi:hypothetical protein